MVLPDRRHVMVIPVKRHFTVATRQVMVVPGTRHVIVATRHVIVVPATRHVMVVHVTLYVMVVPVTRHVLVAGDWYKNILGNLPFSVVCTYIPCLVNSRAAPCSWV